MFKTSALLVLLCVGAQAQTFDALAQTVLANFPETRHFGVVCDYGSNQEAVQELALALGGGSRITVADVKVAENVAKGAQTLSAAGAQMMVLLPRDRFVRDGAYYATVAIHALPVSIPAVGTMRASIENGAVLAQGPDTGGQLVLTPNLRQGYIGKSWILFHGKMSLRPIPPRGEASIQVLHTAR